LFYYLAVTKSVVRVYNARVSMAFGSLGFTQTFFATKRKLDRQWLKNIYRSNSPFASAITEPIWRYALPE